MAIVIAPDGTRTTLTGVNPDGTLSLEQCQKAVGGYIERVCLPGGTAPNDVEMIADEEGLLKPDPVLNPIASAIAGQPIVGTVILVKVVDTAEGQSWR
jgi:hypothetical protein